VNLNICEDGIKGGVAASINSTESSRLQGLVPDSGVTIPSPSTEPLLLLGAVEQREKIGDRHRLV